ncbi:MAG: energy-coupling factor transporter ATPase [Provencibacterium sp.]|jgi:energy-coupling factor transport system ATP-binding protein|nr:energy-coupling factor transporter ATPase [Provencibacterium sp.]
MMPAIKTERLTYTYSPGTPFCKTAVDDVNLEIEEGAFVGVIGHTGSGKSTLIQHFNGLLQPTSGKIYIDGEDLWADKQKLRAFRFKVGLVFQYPEYQLFEDTVYKDIAFGPRNMGMSEEEIDKSVREAAAFVGLKEKTLDRSPFELSGGQKRRVAIAGVLAMKPKVLILDEPTAGLDPKGRDRILSQIRDYHSQVKNTVLLVSHSMEDVARYCGKVLVMNHSRLFLYGDTAEVFEHADEIREMGLAVPQLTRIFHRLSDAGYPVRRNIYTMEEARAELEKLYASKERGRMGC